MCFLYCLNVCVFTHVCKCFFGRLYFFSVNCLCCISESLCMSVSVFVIMCVINAVLKATMEIQKALILDLQLI